MPARLLTVLSTTLLAAGLLSAADTGAANGTLNGSGSASTTDLGTDESPTVRMFMVPMALPHAGETFAEEQLPAPVTKLLSEGWTIANTVVVGKDTGAAEAMVLIALERHQMPNLGNFELFGDHQFHQMLPGGGGAMPGGPRPWQRHDATASPGAGKPAAPADKGDLTVHWTDGVTTTITVGEAIGVRAKAHVKTMDASGKVAAEYDCTAFKDASGAVEVDGRGAMVTPDNQGYSPDSFTIKPDGAVEIEDDTGTRDNGRTDHPPTPTAPPGGTKERQL